MNQFSPHESAATPWDGHVEHGPTDVDRRRFLELAAASLALAGGGGCSMRQPDEEIVPYVRAPEYQIPGKPRHYATAVTLSGYATGVLVEQHQGRPTRIDGNPQHPASLGGIDAISQAAILSLYDPERSQAITAGEEIRTWDSVVNDVETALQGQSAKQGSGLRILTETVTSPTLADQLTRLLEKYPRAKWHQYEPVNQDNVWAGAQLALGQPVETRFFLDRADVVVALDSDFLTYGPGHVRDAHDFTGRRRLPSPEDQDAMNRLYVVESNLTSTGAMADHRLPLKPRQIPAAAAYLAAAVGVETAAHDEFPELPKDVRQWFDTLAEDLQAKHGLVIVGPWQPAAVHAWGHAINAAIGAVDNTLEYSQPVAARAENHLPSLRDLVASVQNGDVDLLLIAGGNPAFDAPADIPFAEALQQVEFSLRLSLYEDETSRLCDLRIPRAHELESWSDARAFDGSVSILQPLIEPLYDGKTDHDMLSLLLGDAALTSHDVVRGYWQGWHDDYGDHDDDGDHGDHGDDDGFERFWRTALHEGIIDGTRFNAIAPKLSERFTADIPSDAFPQETRDADASKAESIEIVFRPDPTIFDGRFANNAWLQELPKPITKLTWDNAALLSPATASSLGVQNEQLIEFTVDGAAVRLPAWIVPGHADGTATVFLGYGRTATGSVGSAAGTDVRPIRHSAAFWCAGNASAKPLSERQRLACTQQHHRMEGRDLIQTATWQQYHDHPNFANGHAHSEHLSLYPQPAGQGETDDYAWGMSINLNSCTGCNACVIACQAENNIPTVGKDEVGRGREMHWMRIDQYFVGEGDSAQSVHQPVTCMHCENAPCEVVCPVAATVHSSEGLNEMVYNRCVGTRYCSNNCPYKVRRFNFLHYVDDQSPLLQLLRNPDVTVRSRGVMEKCTYCVQRISAARIAAKKEYRSIRDGEVTTACQAVCPTEAIVFGDTADPDSSLSKHKSHPLDYGLLTELNTRPRTTYLARVTNPHHDLK